MPEDYEDKSAYALGFAQWLSDFTAEQGLEGPDVVDLATIALTVLARMRAVLLAEELHTAVHNMLEYVDEKLNERGGIVAEHWRHLGEEGYEMYRQAALAEAPDDLSALIEQEFPSGHDLRD